MSNEQSESLKAPKQSKAIAVEPEPVKEMSKTLTNTSVAEVKVKVPDVKVVGNGDSFKLLFKASSESEGWMKSTKALELPQGCLVQVTTQQRNGDGTYSLAEALTFAPGVRIADDVNGGRKLVNIY